MHPAAHALRAKLDAGQPVLGTFLVEFATSGAVQALADAGFDFAIIDCEHGNLDPAAVAATIEAAWGAGLCALLRPPLEQRSLVTSALDAGAAGLVFPAIDSLAQVQQAVRVSKYTPLGKRGVHLMRGHNRHRPVEPVSFMAEANQQLLTLIQIELAGAVALVDQIAATPGVDGLYVGPGDLSVDLGVAGQWESPLLIRAIEQTAAACRRHGKYLACHTDDLGRVPALRQLGVQIIGYSCDVGFFRAAAADLVGRFRAATT